MNRTGPLSTYNRFIAHRKEDGTDISTSLLGLFGAGEAMLLSSFVHWWRGDQTAFDVPPIKYSSGAWSLPNKPSIHISDLLRK